MPLTKKQLIEALQNLDVPDDTIVLTSCGIGYDPFYGVNVQSLVSSSSMDNKEISAIVLE